MWYIEWELCGGKMKKFDMISLEEAGKMAIEEDCIVVDLRGRLWCFSYWKCN